jgi:hypothetical protein
MKKLLIALGVVIVAIILFVIFKKDSTYEAENFAIGQALVSSVSTSFEESFPLGVRVEVRGEFSDTCTILGDVIQNREDGSIDFDVVIETKRPLDGECEQVVTPFETSFILEGTTGLAKGTYGVTVNDVGTTFTFEVDNFISSIDTLK